MTFNFKVGKKFKTRCGVEVTVVLVNSGEMFPVKVVTNEAMPRPIMYDFDGAPLTAAAHLFDIVEEIKGASDESETNRVTAINPDSL